MAVAQCELGDPPGAFRDGGFVELFAEVGPASPGQLPDIVREFDLWHIGQVISGEAQEFHESLERDTGDSRSSNINRYSFHFRVGECSDAGVGDPRPVHVHFSAIERATRLDDDLAIRSESDQRRGIEQIVHAGE